MTELKLFYFVAGFLLLTNIGTIVAVLKDKTKEAYAKGAKDKETEKNFERLEHNINKAHERMDKFKKEFKEHISESH